MKKRYILLPVLLLAVVFCWAGLRTPDGKLMPMGLFHSLQASWNEICFAGMGSGKSFFLNTLNFFFVVRPGQTRLPWLTVIDIGPSCAGVIELVRQSLPPEKRHLAVFARLRNVREAAINPCSNSTVTRWVDGATYLLFCSILMLF